MDSTYAYLYKKLYRHYYRFCTTGVFISQENEKKLNSAISITNDIFLKELYKMIGYVVSLEERKFAGQKQELEKSIDKENYLDKWILYSILCLTYQYVFPNIVNFNYFKKLKQMARDHLKDDLSFDFDLNDYNIEMHIEKKRTVTDEYRKKISGNSHRDFRLNNRNFIMLLKGFSSSSPFFYPAFRERFHHIPIKGGGFYLKWENYGIVIDPGINFMENMHQNDLNIFDVNVVIVTHNHIDHNGDLITIDDLSSQAEKEDIELYCDKDTDREYGGRLKNFKNTHTMDAKISKYDINDNVCLEFKQTEHIIKDKDKDKDKDNEYIKDKTWAVKLILKIDGKIQKTVGFTSDTRYMDDLPNFFNDCNYIIANISETSDDDYHLKTFKDAHLGYRGCLELISAINKNKKSKPQFIISEFWAGKGDIRKELVKKLRESSKYEFIYPGDIGMMFFLDNETFLCGYCYSEVSLKELHVIRTKHEYSTLSTICNHCIL